MIIRVEGLEDLKRDLSTIQGQLVTKTLLQESVRLTRKRIRLRTLGGRDFEEKSFIPYSPGYSAWKGTTLVNLKLSADMLNDINYRVDEGNWRGELYFSKSELEDRMLKHNTGKGVPERRFFAVNSEDAEEVRKLVFLHFGNVIKSVD